MKKDKNGIFDSGDKGGNRLFPMTRMLSAAQNAPRKPRGVIFYFAVFLLVLVAGSVIANVILTPAQMVVLYSNEAFEQTFTDFMSNGITEESYNALYDLLEDILLHPPVWLIFVELVSTIGTVAAVIIFCRAIEKRSFESLGLHRRGAVAEYAAGLAIGGAMLALTVGVCAWWDSATVSLNPDISYGWVIAFFFGYVIQGMSEELLCRGFFMISLSRKCPIWLCVSANAILFAALHLGNNGISSIAFINLLLFGALMSFYTLRRGSLWGSAAIHTAWNFVQGNVFGVSVSGTPATPSVFKFEAGQGRTAELFTGGAFGIEGGLATTIVLVAVIGAILFLSTKKSEIVDEPERADEEKD